MISEHKYGKLAQSDIEAILLILPQLEKERKAFQALIAQKPKKFSKKFLTTGFAWAHLYEVPFEELVSTFLALADVDNAIKQAATHEAPIR